MDLDGEIGGCERAGSIKYLISSGAASPANEATFSICFSARWSAEAGNAAPIATITTAPNAIRLIVHFIGVLALVDCLRWDLGR